MELKRVIAPSESVAITSQPNKKRRFTTKQEMQWQTRLQDLQEFLQSHGHCRVPYKYTQNPSLGIWVSRMRTEFNKRQNGKESSLTAERVAALNNLGFDWAINEAWEIRLGELRDFHQTNGHCRVPRKYPLNPSLGRWVSTMRKEFKKRENGQESSLTAERMAALNILGFYWAFDHRLLYDEAWKLRLEELRDFHQTNGHCRVPRKYTLNPSLGRWVNGIRTEFKQKEGQQPRLTIERIAALNNLGFDWVVGRGNGPAGIDVTWKLRVKKVREFRQSHGHQQHHHVQKEVAPVVPRRVSEEGGFAFEETSHTMSGELERHKDQATPQNQHQPHQPSPPNVFYSIHTSRNSTTDLI